MSENEKVYFPEVDGVNKKELIPIEAIIELRSKNLSYSQIGKILGCSRENVCLRLSRAGYKKEDLANFKKHRGDVLAFFQSKLLNSVTDEDIKKINVYQRVISAGVLYDKERLERGKSTENVDFRQLTMTLSELQAEQARLEKELNLTEGLSGATDAG